MLKGTVVFVGVGNPMLGDDALGPYLAKRIKGGINAETVPENFISKITGMSPDTVVIFDALEFGGAPGEVRIVKAKTAGGILLSTHALPLSKFARMLEPASVWLVGVQPKGARFGEGMCEEVRTSAERILVEVAEFGGKRGLRA